MRKGSEVLHQQEKTPTHAVDYYCVRACVRVFLVQSRLLGKTFLSKCSPLTDGYYLVGRVRGKGCLH